MFDARFYGTIRLKSHTFIRFRNAFKMFFLSIFGGSEFTALPDAFRKYATISQYEYTRRLNKRSTKPYTTIQTFYT